MEKQQKHLHHPFLSSLFISLTIHALFITLFHNTKPHILSNPIYQEKLIIESFQRDILPLSESASSDELLSNTQLLIKNPDQAPIALTKKIMSLIPPPPLNFPAHLHPAISPEPTTITQGLEIEKTPVETYTAWTKPGIFKSQPEYPESARNRSLQGLVLMMVFVNELGHVTSYKIVKSSGHTELDQAALHFMNQQKQANTSWIPESGEARQMLYPIIYRID